MTRAREGDRLNALRDRDEATRVHTTTLRMVSIQFDGEASAFADVVDDAFRMARDAAIAKKSIDKTIIKKGVRAHVKVDP